MAEADAKATVAALKAAALIKSKKADWRLVAAAQAMLRAPRRTPIDEFAAAAAMGKPIKQRREVSNWLDRLRELERMRASLRSRPGGSGSAAGSSLLAQVGSSLLAQPCWNRRACSREQKNFTTKLPRTTLGTGLARTGTNTGIFACSLARHWARDWRALALTQVHQTNKRISLTRNPGNYFSTLEKSFYRTLLEKEFKQNNSLFS